MNIQLPKITPHTTPNPCAVKFILNCHVSLDNPKIFDHPDQCQESNLAKKLLFLDDVTTIFFGDDFITVTKNEQGNWEQMQPQIMQAILDHFALGLNIFNEGASVKTHIKTDSSSVTDEVEKKILQVIEDYIMPAVVMDGGGILYHGFKDGVVKISLTGACKGCPQSTITLKHGIETTLKYHVPEIEKVESIEDEPLPEETT